MKKTKRKIAISISNIHRHKRTHRDNTECMYVSNKIYYENEVKQNCMELVIAILVISMRLWMF